MSYKVVVRDEKDQLNSAFAAGEQLEWTVNYIPGRWAKPVIEHSKLFVFKRKEYAMRFAIATLLLCGCRIEVWRCQTKKLEKIDVIASINQLYSVTEIIKYFWKNRHKVGRVCVCAPVGSYVASEVKLTKLVYERN